MIPIFYHFFLAAKIRQISYISKFWPVINMSSTKTFLQPVEFDVAPTGRVFNISPVRRAPLYFGLTQRKGERKVKT